MPKTRSKRANASPPTLAGQGLLFEEQSSCRALVWVPQPRLRSIPLGKAGREYQRLSKAICSLRAEIDEWESCLVDIQARARREMLPLQEQYGDSLLALLRLVEERLQDPRMRWGKVQLPQAWRTLAWFSQQALEWVGPEHEVALNQFYGVCQEVLGEEESEDNLEEEELIETLLDSLGMRGDAARYDQQKAQGGPKSHRAASSKGTQEPDWESLFRQAAEQKAEAERRAAQKVATEMQSDSLLRSWYRRLVSLLHPDREPNPEERQRKTRQLQELHQAYQTGDVWQVLQQAESLGMATEAFAGEDALKTLNQRLRRQQKYLQGQREKICQEICQRFGLPPFGILRPATLEAHYVQDLQNWRERIRMIQADRERLVATPQETKRWLREIERQRKAWVREQSWWGELQW